MDFEKLWAESRQPEAKMPDKVEIRAMLEKGSAGILAKLKKRMRQKLNWSLALSIASIFLLVPAWSDSGQLGFVCCYLVLQGILLAYLYRYYRALPADDDASMDILTYMKTYSKVIKASLRLEAGVGNFFIFLAANMGALYGAHMSGKSWGDLFSNLPLLLTIFIAASITGVLGILFSLWMNRYAFGAYLKQLDENIRAMSEEEQGDGR